MLSEAKHLARRGRETGETLRFAQGDKSLPRFNGSVSRCHVMNSDEDNENWRKNQSKREGLKVIDLVLIAIF